MSERLEGLCLSLLDLARRQKAAVEAGNVEEASVLALDRRQVLAEIQKFDGAGKPGTPGLPAAVIRQVMSLDGQASDLVRAKMTDISKKLSKINTFKVVCRGVCEEARLRSSSHKA